MVFYRMFWKVNLSLVIRTAAFFTVLCAGRVVEAAQYALVLNDAPAATAMGATLQRETPAVLTARAEIRKKQAALRLELEGRGFNLVGSTDTLLNALYVLAEPKDIPVLRSLPGVKSVVLMRRQHVNLNAAVNLVDAPNAWNVFGGIGNAGSGIKIGIIDTGIDHTHPGFQDSTLQTPAGFPRCNVVSDCAFTNNKVIVARSYVTSTYTSYGPGAANTVPDDPSARDRVGHGTAVAMTAAGNTNIAPLATITGLAPHAYLGSYKVFGTPGINDGASEAAILRALEDAFNDGMDVVNLSLGGAAFGPPSSDLEATEIETLVGKNVVVVVAGGNEGTNGSVFGAPTYSTVGAPGYAPDAIAVAATENSHSVAQSVHVSGPGVPSNLLNIAALQDDVGYVATTLVAPLVDASKSGDGQGCTAYPETPFQGSIALIQRGGGATCTFVAKLNNAEAAGAVGVLFYNNGQLPDVIPPGVFSGNQNIPSFFIGTNDGAALKSYLDTTAGVSVSLDAAIQGFITISGANNVLDFSSRGPALGGALKPDVAAPGDNIYLAAQNYDPNGALYDPSRYTISGGTSFASPIVAGIAALVRQKHPTFTAPQVKSAIVNTATSDTIDTYVSKKTPSPSGVLSVGGGKVEALSAVQTNVTVEPPTLSFGIFAGAVASSQRLTVTNFSGAALTLAIGVTRTVADAATQLTVSAPSLAVPAGQSAMLTVSLNGTKPVPGIYEGAITVTGGSQALHVPYLYLVGDGNAVELIPIAGDRETGIVGQSVPDGLSAFQVIDQFGVPVPNLPLQWTATNGGTVAQSPDIPDGFTTTNQFGIGAAVTTLGATAGSYTFLVKVGTQLTYNFKDDARLLPVISSGGIVNAASFLPGQGVAPGSIASVFGTALSDNTDQASYIPLPIALGSTSLGFDAGTVSIPAPLFFASDKQLNVQIPWELQGQSSAQVKVNVEPSLGQLISLSIVTYSPAIFVQPSQQAAARDAAGIAIDATHAAVRGQLVTLYCTGLGPVTNRPATGAAAPFLPLSSTITSPVVTIGGQPAVVQFSGLAPGFSGLNQVNVTIPAGIAVGVQPVALSIGGVAAPVVNLAIQ